MLSDRVGSRLYRGTLTNALATVYTTPTGRAARVADIAICNTDAAARTVTLKLGGFFLFDALSLAASETVHIELDQVLHDGELIEAFASATGVVDLHVSGQEG